MKTNKKIDYFDILTDGLLNQVRRFLAESGEFYPFGVMIDEIGVIQNITIIDESGVNAVIKETQRVINELISDEQKYQVGGYCVDIRIGGQDALYMDILSQESQGWHRYFLHYSIDADGDIRFGDFFQEEE